jgi:ribA/ribD-fused uncharacterized protein
MNLPAFRGHWAFLSNFHPIHIHYNGVWYRTAEHAYQAQKAVFKSDHDVIAGAATPSEAKRYARRIALRRDWEQVKDQIMLDILRAKFSDPGMAARLLETGDQELVEFNYWNDTYWGVCNGVGQNKLGKLLMKVRSELRFNPYKPPKEH